MKDFWNRFKIVLTIFVGLLLAFAVFMAIIRVSVFIATIIVCLIIAAIIYLVFKLTDRRT
jgi:uncharacterized membrane protein HdeD (DUF308 family)